MIVIKVVRILSAVVLLVQCATCGMTRDEAAVFRYLHSYLEFRQRHRDDLIPTAKLVSVRDHLDVFPKFTLSTVLSGRALTQKEAEKFYTETKYCPTTTMLACGEADVSDEFCLQLLDRVHDYNESVNQYYLASVEADVESERARASSKTGATLSTIPITSSRKVCYRSIPLLFALRVDEVECVISTPPESLEKEYDRLSVEIEAEFKKQSEELKKRQEELKKKREELTEMPKTQWVNKKYEARLRQLAQSSTTLKMLEEFPHVDDLVWLRKQKWSIDTLNGIANSCHPEQFIVCGRHARSVAEGWPRIDALTKCFETIRKYNDFRRLAGTLAHYMTVEKEHRDGRADYVAWLAAKQKVAGN